MDNDPLMAQHPTWHRYNILETSFSTTNCTGTDNWTRNSREKKHTQNQPKNTLNPAENTHKCNSCSYECAYDCAQLHLHNTTQNSSDDHHSYLNLTSRQSSQLRYCHYHLFIAALYEAAFVIK